MVVSLVFYKLKHRNWKPFETEVLPFEFVCMLIKKGQSCVLTYRYSIASVRVLIDASQIVPTLCCILLGTSKIHYPKISYHCFPADRTPFLLIFWFLLLSWSTLHLIPCPIIIVWSSLLLSLILIVHLTYVVQSFCYLFRNCCVYKHVSTMHCQYWKCSLLTPLRITKNSLGID